jgi:hypothetical protein
LLAVVSRALGSYKPLAHVSYPARLLGVEPNVQERCRFWPTAKCTGRLGCQRIRYPYKPAKLCAGRLASRRTTS